MTLGARDVVSLANPVRLQAVMLRELRAYRLERALNQRLQFGIAKLLPPRDQRCLGAITAHRWGGSRGVTGFRKGVGYFDLGFVIVRADRASGQAGEHNQAGKTHSQARALRLIGVLRMSRTTGNTISTKTIRTQKQSM